MNTHGHIDMQNQSGERVKAIAPVIISASRATDIPAFFLPGSSIGLTRDIAYGRIHIMAKIHMSVLQILASSSFGQRIRDHYCHICFSSKIED